MTTEKLAELALMCAKACSVVTKPLGLGFVIHLVDKGDPSVTKQVCVSSGDREYKRIVVMRWLECQLDSDKAQQSEPT